MMVGAEIGEVKLPPAGRPPPRLVVNDLSLEPDEPHGVRLDHVSLELKGGEILGIAGVAGNGQDELFAALSGERLSKDPGAMVIDGMAAGHLRSPSGGGLAQPSCPRSVSATAPRRA